MTRPPRRPRPRWAPSADKRGAPPAWEPDHLAYSGQLRLQQCSSPSPSPSAQAEDGKDKHDHHDQPDQIYDFMHGCFSLLVTGFATLSELPDQVEISAHTHLP